jgi:hypothetical protein
MGFAKALPIPPCWLQSFSDPYFPRWPAGRPGPQDRDGPVVAVDIHHRHSDPAEERGAEEAFQRNSGVSQKRRALRASTGPEREPRAAEDADLRRAAGAVANPPVEGARL